jgi:hypothetical protein
MGLAAMGRPLQAIGKANFMTDLIYVAVMALFFVAGELYAKWCEKL